MNTDKQQQEYGRIIIALNKKLVAAQQRIEELEALLQKYVDKVEALSLHYRFNSLLTETKQALNKQLHE